MQYIFAEIYGPLSIAYVQNCTALSMSWLMLRPETLLVVSKYEPIVHSKRTVQEVLAIPTRHASL